MPRLGEFHGHSKERKAVLVREFGGYPLEDAKAEMYIPVSQEAIKLGVRHDPTECVFAQACKMQLGSPKVVFLRAYAYVAIPDPNPTGWKVLRFALPAKTRRQIASWDSTGVAEVGAFLLRPASKAELLGAPRRASKGPGSHSKPRKRSIDSLTLAGVRSGSGKFNFYKKERVDGPR